MNNVLKLQDLADEMDMQFDESYSYLDKKNNGNNCYN